MTLRDEAIKAGFSEEIYYEQVATHHLVNTFGYSGPVDSQYITDEASLTAMFTFAMEIGSQGIPDHVYEEYLDEVHLSDTERFS